MVNILGRLLKLNTQELAMLLLLGPAMLIPLSDGRSCDNSEECLKKIQTFLHLHSLPFAANEAEMDKLCNTTVEGYNCSTQLVSSRDCLSEEEKNTFKGFVQMAEYTFLMFCPFAPGKEGYLRQAMLENGECMSRKRKSIECCVKGSKIPDVPAMQIIDDLKKSLAEREQAVCCPMANFLKCAEAQAGDLCGPGASNFTLEYIRRSAGEAVQAACQHFPSYPEPDPSYCSAPVPVCDGCSATAFSVSSLVVLLCLLVALCS